MIRRRSLWFTAFAGWAITLWWLSSAARPIYQPDTWLEIDKLYHFGYFFGGAGLLGPAVYLSIPGSKVRTRLLWVTGVLALIGGLDEYHQSFVAGRTGNDLADFVADFLGAGFGAVVFEKLRARVFPFPCRRS